MFLHILLIMTSTLVLLSKIPILRAVFRIPSDSRLFVAAMHPYYLRWQMPKVWHQNRYLVHAQGFRPFFVAPVLIPQCQCFDTTRDADQTKSMLQLFYIVARNVSPAVHELLSHVQVWFGRRCWPPAVRPRITEEEEVALRPHGTRIESSGCPLSERF